MDLTKKLAAIRELLPGLRLQAACGCHPGKRRKNNEDNYYFNGSYLDSDNPGLTGVEHLEVSLGADSFFCVYDGMGGGDFGEVASYTAAKTTKEFLEIRTNMNPCDVTPSLGRLCEAANAAVFAAGERLGTYKMGSTLAGLYFHSGQAWVCNLGDSRCYLFREGHLEQLSEDHTDEAFMKEHGITGRKPYLTQHLGIDPDEMGVVPYVRNLLPEREDRFLICSDGVTDLIETQELGALLECAPSPEDCVRKLIQKALDGGGRDNITALVLDVV